jgi:FkbM family methyltransferase
MASSNHETAIAKWIKVAPQTMYDIGVGPKSEYLELAKVYPKMKIYGCEPHPVLYQALQKKFRWPLLEVAIGSARSATLHAASNDIKVSSLHKASYANQQFDVEVMTLDEFDRNFSCPDGILLWMDIEGSELDALQSGPELLRSGRVRWLNLEERMPGQKAIPGWCDPRDILDLLTSYGYVRACDYNRHTTHQDVIYRHETEPCLR